MTNQPAPNEVNIGDVLRMALPLETAVVSGASHARQNIHWATLLVSWDDLSSQIQQEDLVLVPPALQVGTDPIDLSVRLQEMVQLEAAGVLFFAPIPDKIKESANDWQLPILIAPAESNVRETYRDVATLLVDRQFATAERGMQLYRMLAEMSREEQGIETMTALIGKLTGKIVVVQDKRLDVRASSVPTDTNPDLNMDVLQDILAEPEQLPNVLRNRKAAAKARQTYWQQILPIENIGRLVSPIVAGDRARGYLSIIGPADHLDMLDSLAAEHGAAALALEMAKAKAVSEAKKSLRGDFLEGLLAGTLPIKEIERLEGRLDHNTKQPHVAMTFAWTDEVEAPSLRRLETAVSWVLRNHSRAALVHIYAEQHVCIFQTLKNAEDMDTAYELARRIQDQIDTEYPGANIIAGMSGPANTLAEWPVVYNQALQAMQLGKRLQIGHIVEFNSLGVYRLLGQLEELPAVRSFTEQVIGPLVEYDEQHRSNLVQTIDYFFTHHGNISQTAEALFIHRNTLLYRLDRIQELTNHDLNQSNMRLALHLALKLWQLRPDK